MDDNTYIRRAMCRYCLKEQGIVDTTITIKDYEDREIQVDITQCMHCKMIQPEEV